MSPAVLALAGALVIVAAVLSLVGRRGSGEAVVFARETSILIGTLLGTTVLAEGDRNRRLLCAGAILLGVTALALG